MTKEHICFPIQEEETSSYRTLAQLSELTGYNHQYLKQLFLEGKIRGIKVELGDEPGFWVATEKAIEEYEKTKQRTGRPKGS